VVAGRRAGRPPAVLRDGGTPEGQGGAPCPPRGRRPQRVLRPGGAPGRLHVRDRRPGARYLGRGVGPAGVRHGARDVRQPADPAALPGHRRPVPRRLRAGAVAHPPGPGRNRAVVGGRGGPHARARPPRRPGPAPGGHRPLHREPLGPGDGHRLRHPGRLRPAVAVGGQAGVDPAALMSGHGSHEETAIIDDLWAVSRDRLGLPAFVARHGYHGPFEGELSGVSWREDPTPLVKIVDGYRSMDDSASPAAVEAARAEARREAEARLLAALPRTGQAQARLVLKLAGRYLPLRGVGKVAFLQSLDVARAAARRIGALLAADGVIAEPDDVFYLTAPEVLGVPPAGARDLVAERRAIREGYRALRLPTTWT